MRIKDFDINNESHVRILRGRPKYFIDYFIYYKEYKLLKIKDLNHNFSRGGRNNKLIRDAGNFIIREIKKGKCCQKILTEIKRIDKKS